MNKCCGGVVMDTRDCLQRAWDNTKELVRDFEMYSKRIEDKKVSETFKKMAEEQGMMAHDLRELFNQYDNQKK
jgi:uncharacterized membrane protein (DUF106 family)